MYSRYREAMREAGGAGDGASQETLLHAAKMDRMHARQWVLVLRTHEDVLRTVVRPEDSLRVQFLCELDDRMSRIVKLTKRCRRLVELADNAMAADRLLVSEQAAQAAEALLRAVHGHVGWLYEWLARQVEHDRARVLPGPRTIAAAVDHAREGDVMEISDAGWVLADPEMGRVDVAVEFTDGGEMMWPLDTLHADCLARLREKLLNE